MTHTYTDQREDVVDSGSRIAMGIL